LKLTELNFSPLCDDSSLATFDCGLPDITSFLHDDGKIMAFFSISNDCLNDLGEGKGLNNTVWNRLHRFLRLANEKRIRQYPAIKIGRLGVHQELHGSGLAYQLMDFIKGWTITDQKPACRLLILDAINHAKQLKYYDQNGFKFLLSADEDSRTRMMYYDLEKLSL
jgi:GNAT superfamily N-acetyltransferase